LFDKFFEIENQSERQGCSYWTHRRIAKENTEAHMCKVRDWLNFTKLPAPVVDCNVDGVWAESNIHTEANQSIDLCDEVYTMQHD